MPFTISHSAAVLPFRRTRLVFSALVVGSMSPDFPYFLLLTDRNHFGHTLPGLFFFCLPAGLIVLYAYYKFLRAPALALMPDAIRRRMPADANFRFKPTTQFLWIVVSLLLGAVTHILWDGWTHMNGIFVRHFVELRHGTPFLPKMPWFGLLQQLSSVVGLLIILVATLRWIRRTPDCNFAAVPPVSSRDRVLFFGVGGALACAFGVYYGHITAQLYPRQWAQVFTVRFVIGTISASLLTFALFAVAWHLNKNKAPEAEKLQGREPAGKTAD